MNLNNFIIDRIIRGTAYSQADNTVMFNINQVTNASLSCTSETADAVDAMGTPIATFNRAKQAEFSAENAIFDMNLMATQLGTTKNVASTSNKVTVSTFEEFKASGAKYTLKHTPKTAPVEIFAVNGDSTFGQKYPKATNASATAFAYADGEITLPTGLATGTDMVVMYDYDSENAVEVTNSATKFPTGCKLVLEILGCDVCDQTTLLKAYLEFPNFKISSDFDWSIATDGTHPFSGKAMQSYCDKQKTLFRILVCDDDE